MDRIEENLERIWRVVRLGHAATLASEPGALVQEVIVPGDDPRPASPLAGEKSEPRTDASEPAVKEDVARPRLPQTDEDRLNSIQPSITGQLDVRPNRWEQSPLASTSEPPIDVFSPPATNSAPLPNVEREKVSFFRKILRRIGF